MNRLTPPGSHAKYVMKLTIYSEQGKIQGSGKALTRPSWEVGFWLDGGSPGGLS